MCVEIDEEKDVELKNYDDWQALKSLNELIGMEMEDGQNQEHSKQLLRGCKLTLFRRSC
jgi:hypothetical protein